MKTKVNSKNTMRFRSYVHPMSILNCFLLLLLFFLTLYPFWYVAMVALSSGRSTTGYELIFWPKDFSLASVKYVLETQDFLRIYGNTAFVVVVGTLFSIVATVMLAYGLTQKVFGIRVVKILVLFTMLFSGGMIPTYIIVRSTGLLNSLWALILPVMVSPFNTFILVNAFKGIPHSMEESAELDGAGIMTILFRILFPMIIPTAATIILFYSVGYWNSYFDAMLYLTKHKDWTIQLLLRQLLMVMDDNGASSGDALSRLSNNFKMATVLVSVIPAMCIYPWLQKYFTKGIMVGAVKE